MGKQEGSDDSSLREAVTPYVDDYFSRRDYPLSKAFEHAVLKILHSVERVKAEFREEDGEYVRGYFEGIAFALDFGKELCEGIEARVNDNVDRGEVERDREGVRMAENRSNRKIGEDGERDEGKKTYSSKHDEKGLKKPEKEKDISSLFLGNSENVFIKISGGGYKIIKAEDLEHFRGEFYISAEQIARLSGLSEIKVNGAAKKKGLKRAIWYRLNAKRYCEFVRARMKESDIAKREKDELEAMLMRKRAESENYLCFSLEGVCSAAAYEDFDRERILEICKQKGIEARFDKNTSRHEAVFTQREAGIIANAIVRKVQPEKRVKKEKKIREEGKEENTANEELDVLEELVGDDE